MRTDFVGSAVLAREAVVAPTPARAVRSRYAFGAGNVWASAGMAGSLLASDLLALTLAAELGLAARGLFMGSSGGEIYTAFWPLLILFVIAFRALHIFPPVGMSPAEELRRTTIAITLIYLVAATSSFLGKEAELYSRLTFVFSWAFSLLLVPVFRTFLYGTCARSAWWGYPTVVILGDQQGQTVVDTLQKHRRLGLRPVAVLYEGPPEGRPETQESSVAVTGGLDLALGLARESGIKHAVVVMPLTRRTEFCLKVREVQSCFRTVTVLPNLLGFVSIPHRIKDVGGRMGIVIQNRLLLPVPRFVKRASDLALAIPLGLAALPVLLVTAVWIKLLDHGPVFFCQRRTGLRGEPIHVLKFRTMYEDAEIRLQSYLKENAEAHSEWDRFCKLKRDPRVLPGIGCLLRKFSLDELPQVWNVLKGEMSMVGPRPFPDYHLEHFSRGFRALRETVKPGLTGLWQVEDRSEGDVSAQELHDTYYIENWSLWLDLHIAFKTAKVVLSGRGAY